MDDAAELLLLVCSTWQRNVPMSITVSTDSRINTNVNQEQRQLRQDSDGLGIHSAKTEHQSSLLQWGQPQRPALELPCCDLPASDCAAASLAGLLVFAAALYRPNASQLELRPLKSLAVS